MSEAIPEILDPMYGRPSSPSEVRKARRLREENADYNRARRERIDMCWTCPCLNFHGCDPRHCAKEKRE